MAHRAAASAVLSRSVGCVVAAGAGATWSARAITAAGGWDSTTLLEGRGFHSSTSHLYPRHFCH
jgi:hypothetical protein